MEIQRNEEKWLENIGEIMLDEGDEFFWMLPQIFVSPFRSCVASPYFSYDQEIWRLVMMPSDGDGPDLSDNSYVGLFLWLKGCKTLENKYAVWLSIKVPDKDDICCHNGELDSHYGFGKWDFLAIYRMSKSCILSGRVKICCRIRRIEGGANETLLGVDRLTQNFGDLLHNEWGSDVVLKTKDHEFHAHRIIIGARSPVFSSMLKLDMTEKKTGEVDISDCSTAGFKVFLQYLYTGKADTISSDNVLDLYYIADKYQVGDLKFECVEYMKNALSVDNFCDVITLSLRHGESDLQKLATHFFCRNIMKIGHTVQWEKFVTENPIEANNLYKKGVNA